MAEKLEISIGHSARLRDNCAENATDCSYIQCNSLCTTEQRNLAEKWDSMADLRNEVQLNLDKKYIAVSGTYTKREDSYIDESGKWAIIGLGKTDSRNKAWILHELLLQSPVPCQKTVLISPKKSIL